MKFFTQISTADILRKAQDSEVAIVPDEREQKDPYMAAVEANDTDTVQRMVSEAAKAAGYTVGPVFHGTLTGGFTAFNPLLIGSATDSGWFGRAFWFCDDKGYSSANYAGEWYGKLPDGAEVKEVYLRMKNPKIIPWVDETERSRRTSDPEQATEEAIAGGHDGLKVVKNPRYGEWYEYGVFDSSQIKSADPITLRDPNRPATLDNVIPLSERFNSSNPDIRY
jgi:hypothetical protein